MPRSWRRWPAACRSWRREQEGEAMVEKTPEGEKVQFVIFKLNESEFGVEIGQVLRITRLMEVTRVPRAPRFLEGVVNVHGEIIPVLDLKKRLDLPVGEYGDQARILIVEVEGQKVGMLVDSVTEIAWIPVSAIQPPPEMVAEISGVYLKGLGRLDNRLIIILDLSRVLSAEEVEELERAEIKPPADSEATPTGG
ncbi:MAG TPA: chemotaxis protein CheW [Chloroflexi bacterium]|nr:chemotaxis protein CheW [Chloroflexota bacterium]